MKDIKLYEIYFSKIIKPTALDFLIYYLYKLNDTILFKNMLYGIIYFLEKKKFEKYPKDTKLIETYNCNFIAQTANGFNVCNQIHRTLPYDVFDIRLEDGYKILCADTHMIYADVNKGLQGWRFANEVKLNDFIYTANGWKKIQSIKKKKLKMFMCDISLENEN
ncbi:MAG: hypothetical protein [Wendovervirus sonii]|uniref:Uncharacterized protein n=1 Tax=phage Lak_Megaphage_Sonny TaxID=3109229 RepID=A0ABN3YP78_9CAUD|nr:MAG: hypothetical protein [phage Lak_Megaphage_Sonny]